MADSSVSMASSRLNTTRPRLHHYPSSASHTYSLSATGARTGPPATTSIPPSPSSQLPIIILGAGPAGLSLAQSLLHKPLTPTRPIHIFERDPSPHVRRQGYRLRLAPIGVASLRKLLPPQIFDELRATSGELAVGVTTAPKPSDCFDAHTADLLSVSGLEGKATGPRLNSVGQGEIWAVDRRVMRNVLLKGLEDVVQWGKEVVKVEDQGSAGALVRFADGSEVRGALVIGADGSRSKARQAVCNMKTLDTGGRWVFGKTPLTAGLEACFTGVLNRMVIIKDMEFKDEGRPPLCGLLEAMRFGKTRKDVPRNYIYWVLQTRSESFEESDEELLKMNGPEAAALARRMTKSWSPHYKAIFKTANVNSVAVMKVTSTPPVIPFWESGNVTLVGDAAHVMSPTAAVGATTALRDAAELLEQVREGGMKKEAVGRYEEKMRAYVSEAIKMSGLSGKWIFGMKNWEDMEPVEG